MLVQIFCVATVLFSQGVSDPVIGGEDVGKVELTDTHVITGQKEYPFMARLYIITKSLSPGSSKTEEMYTCGGVIITRDAIITAAHCLTTSFSEPLIYVQVGFVHTVYEHLSTPGSWATNYVINEAFVKQLDVADDLSVAYMCDIAIVFLETPLVFTDTVQKAVFNEFDGSLAGMEGTVLGWGIDDSGIGANILQKGDTRIIPNDECRKHISETIIMPDHFCILSASKSVSPCIGDSGGPFISAGKVFGIASFAFPENKEGGRACDPEKPQVFTRVGMFTEWIREKLRENQCNRRYDNAVSETPLVKKAKPTLTEISKSKPL